MYTPLNPIYFVYKVGFSRVVITRACLHSAPIFMPPPPPPRDASQGTLRLAPICPFVGSSVCLSHFTVKSLCNQILLQFSMDLFETLHTCCGHYENVRVGFDGARIDFDRIMACQT